MLKKLKAFFKKYKVLVIVFGFILLVFALILFTLFSEEETQDLETERVQEENGLRRYYDNYQINFPGYLVEEVDRYSSSYSLFKVQDVSHLDWVKNFVAAIGATNLEYNVRKHPPVVGEPLYTIDQSTHYWVNKGELVAYHEGLDLYRESVIDSVTYDNATDLLSFKFDEGKVVPGLRVNPGEIDSVEVWLKKVSQSFFSDEFEYVINEIDRIGDDYRINYSRLLDGVAISESPWNYYLLFSQEGRLKEGTFLLAEFTEIAEESIPSGEEIRDKINDHNYKKSISFEFLDINESDEFGPYGSYERVNHQIGSIDLELVELQYRYHAKFDEVIKPVFFFGGEGYVEIEGEEYRAYFEIEIE